MSAALSPVHQVYQSSELCVPIQRSLCTNPGTDEPKKSTLLLGMYCMAILYCRSKSSEGHAVLAESFACGAQLHRGRPILYYCNVMYSTIQYYACRTAGICSHVQDVHHSFVTCTRSAPRWRRSWPVHSNSTIVVANTNCCRWRLHTVCWY